MKKNFSSSKKSMKFKNKKFDQNFKQYQEKKEYQKKISSNLNSKFGKLSLKQEQVREIKILQTRLILLGKYFVLVCLK